jgi:hypothetical protein
LLLEFGKEVGGDTGVAPVPFRLKKLGSDNFGTRLPKLNERGCFGTMGATTALDVSTGVNVNC